MNAQAKETEKFMANLVTKTDIQRIYDRFENYASFTEMNKFKQEVLPIATKCEKELAKYQLQNAQMKEMIRRFDELISDKVNKYTHKKLEDHVTATYLEKSRWEPIEREFEEIRKE